MVGAEGGKNALSFKVDRTACDRVFEGLAFEKFHGDEGHTVLFVNLVDGANVGVVQS